MENILKIGSEEFNNEPVYYCPHCLSLKIKSINKYIDYCADCGCTDIETTTIDKWQEMYKERFNKYYSNYGREEEHNK